MRTYRDASCVRCALKPRFHGIERKRKPFIDPMVSHPFAMYEDQKPDRDLIDLMDWVVNSERTLR